MAEERLQKIMAQAGVGSRRACEEIIRAGRVTVNGRVAELGSKADPESDQVRVDGEPLGRAEVRTVVALYKPRSYLSTDAPHQGDRRPTARSLIKLETRLFPVGRLDAESEGLMLFTNDGKLAQRLSHPRYEHEKEYRVEVYGRPTKGALEKWCNGVDLEEGVTAPAEVSVIRYERGMTWLRVVMHEGWKRQIRRVASTLGYPVRRLTRTRIGPVTLGELKPGEWRPLTPQEQAALQVIRGDKGRKEPGGGTRRR
jgi:23S rRNA pseudouridine2605 synthase